jgi:hypothetical protein
MREKVYVLGAGFCRDFNQDAFPLVRDFLSLAASHGSYKRDSTHLQLAMMIGRYFGNDLYQNIETVLSFFSAEPLDDLGIQFENRPNLYRQLVDLIVWELNRASSIVDRHSQGAWAVYSKFVKHLVSTESAVITFNYDMLLERLLAEEHTNDWHMVDGYGIDIPLTDEAFPTHRVSKSIEVSQAWRSRVLLLKLHGSINWGVPAIAFDKGNKIYRGRSSGGDCMLHRQVKHPGGLPLTLHFEPVIVPPIVDKSVWLKNQTFRYLWNMANQAIQEAKEITFIGYSLPPTDFMTEFMFRQARMGHSEKRVTVISPDAAKLQPRYEDIFGLGVCTIEKRFQEWFVGSEFYSAQ